MNKDYQTGFHLISQLETSGLKYHPVKSGELIRIGDICQLDAGYVADIAALTDTTFCGVAASANTAAEASSDGALNVAMTPPYMHNQFIVPCEATDLITLAQVGIRYESESNDGIDEGAEETTIWCFKVDAIDVSAEAIAAATFGFAIGHFELLSGA